MKKRIKALISSFLFAAMVMLLMILLVGAVMFAYAVVTESIPTSWEKAGAIFVVLVGMAVWVLLQSNDAEGDDDA